MVMTLCQFENAADEADRFDRRLDCERTEILRALASPPKYIELIRLTALVREKNESFLEWLESSGDSEGSFAILLHGLAVLVQDQNEKPLIGLMEEWLAHEIDKKTKESEQ